MTATVTSLDVREEAAAPAAEVQHAPWPSPARAYYTVIMMALAVMFAEIDRNAMSLLIQPIKAVYHLSDTWIGFLMGPVFAILYAAFGVPTSRFIDRYNRKAILAWALGLWSTAAACCGLAQNFVQLATARLLLGAAESPNGPAIFSIIADSFTRKHLTRGISIMQIGTSIGAGFALLMTGFLIRALVAIPDVHIAGIGVLRWWQLVFIGVGLPGILVAVVIALTVKEPARQGPPTKSNVSLGEVLAYMGSKWRIFGAFMGSSAIGGLGMGVLAWNAEFYRRTYHWAPADIGIRMGLVSMVATLTGLVLGTWLYERFVGQGRRDAAMRVVLLGRLIGLPMALMMPLMPNGWLALMFTGISGVILGATGGSTNSILQIISPNRMRGQITAIFFVFYSLIGNGLSPWLIGFANDVILHDESKLRYAILGAGLLFQPASLFVLWLGRKAYAREVEAIEAAEAAAKA
jgi:MFS family permease